MAQWSIKVIHNMCIRKLSPYNWFWPRLG